MVRAPANAPRCAFRLRSVNSAILPTNSIWPGESEKGHAALADVTAYAAMARDSAIQSHKHEKQAEIAIRKMTRKLSDMKHLLAREDQEPAQNTD